MAIQILNRAPDLADFTPLQEHQESTPGVFFGGKPVLHLRAPHATLVQPKHIGAAATWPAFQSSSATNGQSTTNGDAGESDETVTVGGVDVFVTSERLILFSSASSTGASIPYPTISLHAIQRLDTGLVAQTQHTHGIYMQLLLSEPRGVDDEDVETLELTLVPGADVEVPGAPPTTSEAPASAEGAAASDTETTTTPTQRLFAALSTCADLNPDRSDDEGEGGAGDDYPAPGTGGWITADNMDEFADAEGEFAGFGGIPVLGDMAGASGEVPVVAGTVRSREEEEDGGEGDGEEAGEGEETKWRRTG
ncbi:regulator of volume decrease after cellular swelling-domain-containing protein [Phyllosticta citribraziliensis]|uniref:Regulator of volume decrease after cellular swelling-domain-containing protein n=1 Tax=Phyllosticta citribraziliensis TaxID=989973 RepID=A0ABR1ME49_9PEZI